MEIQNKSTIPEVHETIVKLRELSADEKLKREAYYREKRLHDEASAIIGSRREGRAEGRAEGLAEGLAKGLAEGRTKGLAEGRTKGLAEGRTKGLAEGRTKERDVIIKNMRKNGFTEEQIKLVLGNESDE